MRKKIREAIESVLRSLGEAGEISFTVERPRGFEHGDYATNAAMVAKVDAQKLADGLRIEGVERVEVAGKFINLFLSREVIEDTVQRAAQEKDWGKNYLYTGKKIMVEYTSPNLFKPLHIGNLVGNILGESLARLFEDSSAEVKRINYPSDIGLTVAKGVWGLQKLSLDPTDIAQLGRAYVAGNEAYESGAAKEEIEEINRALYENSNPEWSALRERGIETSRRHLDDLCARLGTTFDKEFFESQSGPVGREIVLAHVADGVFEQSDGAIVFRGEAHGLHTRVFLTSQGLPTYEAKDLGLLKLKLQAFPDFDISITDTGPEQQEYFKVLYAVARKIFPELSGKSLMHTVHGTLKLTTGKMSSRKGNVITGESLLADLAAVAKEKMKGRALADADKVAEQIAVGAVKYAVLKQGSGRDIMFDPEKSLSLEGDSGPYLQYARVRAVSLLREAAKVGIKTPTSDVRVLDRPERANRLERTLLHFSDALERGARELEPHYLTTYLTELASAFNGWYAGEKVIGGTHPHWGVLLAAAFERTMSVGLGTLGIPASEEM